MTLRRRWLAALAVVGSACAGAGAPVSSAETEPAPPAAPATHADEPPAAAAEPTPSDLVEPSAAPSVAPGSDHADASCVVWRSGSLEHPTAIGTTALAFAHTLDPVGPWGYDGLDDVHTIELRDVDGPRLRARLVVGRPAGALAVSGDGALLAAAVDDRVRVISTADGTTRAEVPGAALALAFGPGGELAISRGDQVAVADPGSFEIARTLPIAGRAPSVIHAMMSDGECQEIFTDTEARATTLGFAADGTLVAGVSDGTLRRLVTDDATRYAHPQERDFGYAVVAVAILPGSAPDRVRTVWGDGHEVELEAATMRPVRRRSVACTADERAALRVGDGSADGCGFVRSATVQGDLTLYLGGGARVRRGAAVPVMAAPTLHEQGGLLVAAPTGSEAWLFGVGGTVERWTTTRPARFLGPLAIGGRGGSVVEISESGRYVVTSIADEVPYSNEWPPVTLTTWDTRAGRAVPALGGRGHAARFVDGERRLVLQLEPTSARPPGSDVHDFVVEVREIPSGATVRRIALAPVRYGGLVTADARRVVVAEDARVRVVDVETGAERAIALDPGAITRGELRGDRLVVLVYDLGTSDIHDHRVEVIDLSGAELRVVARATRAIDGGLVVERGQAIYVASGGAVTAMDLETGASAPIGGEPSRFVGAWADGRALGRDGIGGRHLVGPGGAVLGPALLDVQRISDRERAAILFELGGAAYVVGHDGATRASLHAVDGGLVIEPVGAEPWSTAGAVAALARRAGDRLEPCGAPAVASAGPSVLEQAIAR